VSPFVHVAFTGAAPPPEPEFPVIASTITGATTTANANHTINFPSGSTTGDLVIVVFRIPADDGESVPAGWTQAASRTSGGYTRVFWRILEGGDGSSVTYTSGTSTARRAAWVAYRITGAHATAPVEANVAGGLNPSNLAPTWGDNLKHLWITYTATRRADNSFTMPSPYGTQLDAETSASDASTVHCRVSSAHRTNEASSENADAWTNTGTLDNNASGTIAVRPT
jgi:hypothetical protein